MFVCSLQQSASSLVCDMVLLEGECVVSESSLTGESVPVVKTSLPLHQSASDPAFDINVHARHVLFSGTDMRRVKVQIMLLFLVFETTIGSCQRTCFANWISDFQRRADQTDFVSKGDKSLNFWAGFADSHVLKAFGVSVLPRCPVVCGVSFCGDFGIVWMGHLEVCDERSNMVVHHIASSRSVHHRHSSCSPHRDVCRCECFSFSWGEFLMCVD